MYHTTGDIERVNWFGRWSSGAFHGYLWEADELSKGLATVMAKDEATIHNE